MPLLLDTNRWQDVLDNVEQYSEMFPGGKYESEIKNKVEDMLQEMEV
jgi:hypothetical protein